MEAEDILQSRIQSCARFVRSILQNSENRYVRDVSVDDESDLDAFVLRLYAQKEISEETCLSPEDAGNFALDIAGILEDIAAAHSFLDMEGSFSVEYEGEKKAYRFSSEGGQDYCDIEEDGC